MDPKPFAGQIALVTGGSRGIGRAIAQKLGSMGAEVIVNYVRREADAQLAVAELTELGVTASALQGNMGDLDDIHDLFAKVKESHGGLDILVNSAARGLERPRGAMASLPQHLRTTFETNVLGPWFAAKEAAPLMEARGGGAIVNLTSLGAQRYTPNYAAVGVTKGALDTLTMYLAVELAGKHIRVNGVCPSWVEDTSGVRAMDGGFGEKLRQSIPAGRHVTPGDVANLVAYLCTTEAEMIIGQTIVLDGGVSLIGMFDVAVKTALPAPRHRWYAAFYARVIEPSDRKTMGPLRAVAAGDAYGRVFEPGAGTGANLAYYDWSKIERLDLAEPDPYMRQHIEPKLAALPTDVRDRVHLSDAPAEALPFEDATFDCAVCTLVLCSVEDLPKTLSELRRVLKPGGELRLIEHVAAEGAWGKVQRIIQPVYGWMSGECRLHRSTEAALRDAGFDVTVIERMKLGVPIFPAFAGTATPRDPLTL